MNTENGISYSRKAQDKFSPFKPFQYRGTSPSGVDMGVSTIYCLDRKDFLSLLDYWTRAGYKYFAVS